MSERTAKYSIGTQFKSRGKHPRLYTVIDIHRTYNAAGEMVKLRYVATFELMGQKVTDYDVVETSISMGYYLPTVAA
jgi:hypothetical protein